MKNFNKHFFIIAIAILFVACGGNDKNEHNNRMTFKGTHETKKGSIYSFRMEDRLAVLTVGEQSSSIMLYSIQFSDNKNIISYIEEFNFNIPGIKMAIENGDTIFSGSNLTPEISINTYNLGDQGFEVLKLSGSLHDGMLNLDYTIKRSGVTLEEEFRGTKQ